MPLISFRVHSLASSSRDRDGLAAIRSPYTAEAEDLTFEDAEEWLDSLERQGVRSRVVTLNPAGRVSVQWAA